MYFNINDTIAGFIILQPFMFQYHDITFILFIAKKNCRNNIHLLLYINTFVHIFY